MLHDRIDPSLPDVDPYETEEAAGELAGAVLGLGMVALSGALVGSALTLAAIFTWGWFA